MQYEVSQYDGSVFREMSEREKVERKKGLLETQVKMLKQISLGENGVSCFVLESQVNI